MNIAVVGSSGYIAQYIIAHLKVVNSANCLIRFGRSLSQDAQYLDLNNFETFNCNKLKNIDYLIFTAAISSPDQCAKEFDNSWNINVTGTTALIKEALKRQCKVIFFSSDAVYGDEPGKIYDELSETNGRTAYGQMKKAVEDRFKGNPLFKAIRLSYAVSSNDKFTSYCLSCIRNNKEAEIFHPFYRNCTTVTDVVDVVEWLIKHWECLDSNFLNICGVELVSRLRIADELNRIYFNRLHYKVIDPGTAFYANRPAITQMKSIYLESLHIVPVKSFTEKLISELKEK